MNRKLLILLMITALLVGVMAGCAPSAGEQQNAEQYIDPVYPPHYEMVYKELMGVDLNTAIAKLGYEPDDFIIIDHPTVPHYRSKETVTYLGHEFHVELWLAEGDSRLAQVRLYSELSGSPEEQAKAGVEMLHTLRKMFGLHLAKKDEELEKKYTPEEADSVEWLSGDEEKAWGSIWELYYDLDHIPEKAFRGKPERDECAFLLTYQMVYDPNLKGAYLNLVYEIGIKASNHFVKN